MRDDSGAERLVIRSFREGDESAILDLFERSFHQPRSRGHFDWKFRRDPYGSQHITVAFDGLALVGHYAGYAVPFRSRNGDFIAHQIGDTMTDPAVRHIGRGPTSVLGRTALHFYETFCRDRVAFNYGFNVANIQKFSLRFLRSDCVEPVTYWTRDLRRLPIRPIRRAERLLRGYRLELVREIGDEWDRFFESAWREYDFLVRREAAYLRWRYFERPDVQYIVVAIRKWRQLAGWSVFRLRDNRLTWGDAMFDRRWPDAAEVMLRHVVPQFGSEVVDGWFSSRPAWFAAMLRQMQFDIVAEPQGLSVMCVPFERADAVAEMRQSFYYTAGDSDLF